MLSEHGKFRLLNLPSCQTESVVSRTWNCNHEKSCRICNMATDYIFILTQVTNRTLKTSYSILLSRCILGLHWYLRILFSGQTFLTFPLWAARVFLVISLKNTPSLWASHFRKLKSLSQNGPQIQQNIPNICFKCLDLSSFFSGKWSSNYLCISWTRTVFALPKVMSSRKREMDLSSDSSLLPPPLQDCPFHPHLPFSIHCILPTLHLTSLFLGLCVLIFFLQIINPRMWTSRPWINHFPTPSHTGIA